MELSHSYELPGEAGRESNKDLSACKGRLTVLSVELSALQRKEAREYFVELTLDTSLLAVTLKLHVQAFKSHRANSISTIRALAAADTYRVHMRLLCSYLAIQGATPSTTSESCHGAVYCFEHITNWGPPLQTSYPGALHVTVQVDIQKESNPNIVLVKIRKLTDRAISNR